MEFRCIQCGDTYALDDILYACRRCGDLLDVHYDPQELERRMVDTDWKARPLGVWKYSVFLPFPEDIEPLSLGEGGTGLHRCRRLEKELGIHSLYVKNEGENPTGSFKDRGMTVGVTKALQLGFKTVICASTGNTASSLAAYAARGGLKCIILVPAGNIALGKLAQAIMYGAKVLAVRGNFDDALGLVGRYVEEGDVYLLNSLNPFRIEGQKTAAFEICEQLGWKAPDRLIIPVGNAGNITAYWKGFMEFQSLGIVQGLPKMVGVQSEGAAPIVKAYNLGLSVLEPEPNPETIATAIKIGNPVNWRRAIQAIRDSGGLAISVGDEEILEAQKLLASKEGIFVEPSSATPLAALKKLLKAGRIDPEETIVCVATGHGLKDPEIALKGCKAPLEIDVDLDSLRKAVEA
ncbi:threonine synthase [Candidatus Bathyarchaeota archaeon]|nr:threonine synthase [Candidatus Bathyarchaeota archaeon]